MHTIIITYTCTYLSVRRSFFGINSDTTNIASSYYTYSSSSAVGHKHDMQTFVGPVPADVDRGRPDVVVGVCLCGRSRCSSRRPVFLSSWGFTFFLLVVPKPLLLQTSTYDVRSCSAVRCYDPEYFTDILSVVVSALRTTRSVYEYIICGRSCFSLIYWYYLR